MLGQKKIENMMIPCEISKDRPNGEDNKLSFQHFECELPMETNNRKNNHDPFTQAPRGARPWFCARPVQLSQKRSEAGSTMIFISQVGTLKLREARPVGKGCYLCLGAHATLH